MSNENKYGFSIPYNDKPDHEPDDSFLTHWDIEEYPQYVAEAAAEHYHDNDGHEASWPCTVQIFDATGVSRGIFTVEREYEPIFSATPLK
ncbi:MAG: hypothetical protein GY833_12750 [Aestuariibacter sp.]|nr:hypothetical protein [Aestuariibacter sp.]|tara:strand:+ start:129570 stop:129839 length:270 start_codon:yes stop_codon:yes gene_type:complete